MFSQNPFVATIRIASRSFTGFFKQTIPEAVEPPPFVGPPLRILCADDIPANQSLISKTLQRRGHRVDIVGDGREAAERARQRAYDIILMDLQMPVMDGFEATAVIRNEEKNSAPVPIVALTAHTFPDDRRRCVAVGMDAYMSKPFDVRALIVLVESLASDRRRPVAGRSALMTSVESSESSDPVLDLQGALRRLAGDRQLFDDMAQFFREDSPVLLDRVRDGIDRRDAPAVVLAAHALKGLAASCGGVRAAAAAAQIEQLGRDDDFPGLDASLPRLESALAKLDEALARA